jgi:hypothetical protein
MNCQFIFPGKDLEKILFFYCSCIANLRLIRITHTIFYPDRKLNQYKLDKNNYLPGIVIKNKPTGFYDLRKS